MGHLEFRKNVDGWRFNIIIPQFCDPAFQHFLTWCYLVKNLDTEDVTCDWVPPSWSMLDPGKEISAMKEGIRTGLISYPKAIRELGNEPDETLQEIADTNKTLDDLEITLDIDPRKTTMAGILQVEPINQNGVINAKQDNQKIPSDGTSTKSN
jgi:capsid protein